MNHERAAIHDLTPNALETSGVGAYDAAAAELL